MERVSSGIEGFDTLVSGGFPAGRTYLVAGEPGTGKTLFCLQFLIQGAQQGQKGIYISIDERPEHVIFNAEALGWEIRSHLESGMIQILDVTTYFSKSQVSGEGGIQIDHIVEDILGYVEKMGARRLAIDPIAPLVFSGRNNPDITEYIRRLVFALEDNAQCTTLLTSYVPVGTDRVSQHGIEEFAASGIIVLKLSKMNGKCIRTVWVRKMRATKIDLSEHSYEILPKRGLVLRHPV